MSIFNSIDGGVGYATPMDEAGDGTGGAGAGGGAGGDGDAGAGGDGAAGDGAGGNDGHFLDGVTSPELKAWGITKGWKDADAVLQSTRHLEGLLGAPADQIVRIPQGGVDLENGREIYGRLGMPQSADEYKFNVPEGMEPDTNMQAWARETFHKLGLSSTQASKLNDEFNTMQATQAESASESFTASIQAGDLALQKEWGNGYNQMVNQGAAAIRALGISAEMINGMEQTVGYEATMKWAANLGGRLGEDTFVLGNESGGKDFDHGMTPDRARQAYMKKLDDKGWKEALFNKSHPNHKAVMKEKNELYSIMYPGEG